MSVTVRHRMGNRAWSELLMTGRAFDASEAARVGMLTHAVPDDSVDAAVQTVVTDLLAGSAQGHREAKRLANASLRERLAQEATFSSRCRQNSSRRRGREAAIARLIGVH